MRSIRSSSSLTKSDSLSILGSCPASESDSGIALPPFATEPLFIILSYHDVPLRRRRPLSEVFGALWNV